MKERTAADLDKVDRDLAILAIDENKIFNTWRTVILSLILLRLT
jgi:hypothetical protein